jgi:hypothetical protein
MRYHLDGRLTKLESRHGCSRGFHAIRVIVDQWEPGAKGRAEAECQAAVDDMIGSGRASRSDDFFCFQRIMVRPEPRGDRL